LNREFINETGIYYLEKNVSEDPKGKNKIIVSHIKKGKTGLNELRCDASLDKEEVSKIE
jgi:hypothetical protein